MKFSNGQPVSEHRHKCRHCSSVWLCEGTRDTCKIEHTVCWPCQQPDKIRAREAIRVALRDKERNAGTTPSLFDRKSNHGYTVTEYANYTDFVAF